MNRRKAILSLLSVGLSAGLLRVQAAETKQTALPEYELKLLQVADTNPPEYLIYIDKHPGIAYKSLYSQHLRDWVGNLPKGSTITYEPECIGAQMPSTKGMDDIGDFEAFCKSKGVLFKRYYAG